MATKREHDDRETLKRAVFRAKKTAPVVDMPKAAWPTARVESYASSLVRGGLWRGTRVKGNGREAIRQVSSSLRHLLLSVEDLCLTADEILDEAVHEHSAIPVVEVEGQPPETVAGWTASPALGLGVVAITDDPETFRAVALHGAEPWQDDKAASVVLCAWTEKDRVHIHALALAGGIHGIKTIILDLDGSVPDIEENHATRNAYGFEDTAAALCRLASAAVESPAVRMAQLHRERSAVAAPKRVKPERRPSRQPSPRPGPVPVHWAEASAPIERPLLDCADADGLRLMTESNSVLSRLVDELWPMLSRDGTAPAASDPFGAIAASRATATGIVTDRLETLLGNARAHVLSFREDGQDAEADRMQEMADHLVSDRSRAELAEHVGREQFGHLARAYQAAARALASFAISPDDALLDPIDLAGVADAPVITVPHPLRGLHVVRDEDLRHAAAATMADGMTINAKLPVVVIHSANALGAAAVALQLIEGRLAMCVWRHLPVNAPASEDDLGWALRRVVAASIATVHPKREATPTTPAAPPPAPIPAPPAPTTATAPSAPAAQRPASSQAKESAPVRIDMPALRAESHRAMAAALTDALKAPRPALPQAREAVVAPDAVEKRRHEAHDPQPSSFDISSLVGMFDDPEEPGESDGRTVQRAKPPIGRPTRQRQMDEFSEILKAAIAPVLERLDRIEGMLLDRT